MLSTGGSDIVIRLLARGLAAFFVLWIVIGMITVVLLPAVTVANVVNASLEVTAAISIAWLALLGALWSIKSCLKGKNK